MSLNTAEQQLKQTLNLLTTHTKQSIRLSDSKLLKRLESFSSSLWLSKPNLLAPIYCALLGWKCIDKDILVCDTCSRYVSG